VGIRVAAVFADGKDLHPPALQLEPPERSQDGLVLGCPGDDCRSGRQPAAGAEQGQVDRLGAR